MSRRDDQYWFDRAQWEGGGTVVRRTVLIALVILVGWAVWQVRDILILFGLGAFLALVLAPLVRFFEHRGLRRGPAVAMSYLVMIALVAGLVALVAPPVVKQIAEFVQHLPDYVDDIKQSERIRELDADYGFVEKLEENASRLAAQIPDAIAVVQGIVSWLLATAFNLVTVIVVSVFLLLDGRRLRDFLLGQLKPGPRERAEVIIHDVDRAVGGYVFGVSVLALVAGTLSWVVMSIAGVPFAAPLAVTVAVLNFIPIIGSAIAAVIVALVALTVSPGVCLAWVVYFLVYQQVENNLLQPAVYRRTLNLHPLLVIAAVLIGSSQMGLIGALVAIPAAATVQILVKDAWRLRHGEDEGLPGLPAPDRAEGARPVQVWPLDDEG